MLKIEQARQGKARQGKAEVDLGFLGPYHWNALSFYTMHLYPA
jgi:hypothetical protein